MSRASGKFATAVHALAVMSLSEDWTQSDDLAAAMGSQASHLRALISKLARANIVESREGRHGGYRLARPAQRIRLSEVYDSIEGDDLLASSTAQPAKECPVGGGMRAAFDEVGCLARQAVVAALRDQTIADVARRAHTLNGRPVPPPGFRIP
jgi:Rrf2 family protein